MHLDRSILVLDCILRQKLVIFKKNNSSKCHVENFYHHLYVLGVLKKVQRIYEITNALKGTH